MNVYTDMTYWIANKLKMRPNDILYGWGVAELIVAYGKYSNELVSRAYKEWEETPVKQRMGKKVPPEYNVLFFSPEQMQELSKEEDNKNGN